MFLRLLAVLSARKSKIHQLTEFKLRTFPRSSSTFHETTGKLSFLNGSANFYLRTFSLPGTGFRCQGASGDGTDKPLPSCGFYLGRKPLIPNIELFFLSLVPVESRNNFCYYKTYFKMTSNGFFIFQYFRNIWIAKTRKYVHVRTHFSEICEMT